MNRNHPNNVKEIQRLGFSTEDKKEMHTVTITNPDKLGFKLFFRGAAPDFKKEVSSEINASMSGSQVRDRIRPYFKT